MLHARPGPAGTDAHLSVIFPYCCVSRAVHAQRTMAGGIDTCTGVPEVQREPACLSMPRSEWLVSPLQLDDPSCAIVVVAYEARRVRFGLNQIAMDTLFTAEELEDALRRSGVLVELALARCVGHMQDSENNVACKPRSSRPASQGCVDWVEWSFACACIRVRG